MPGEGFEARGRILDAIRKALEGGSQLPVTHLPSTVHPPLRESTGAGRPPSHETAPPTADLARRFAAEWQALGGQFMAERPDRAAARVVELLRERQAETVLAWRETQLPAPGLLDHLRREGFRLAGGEVQADEPARSQRLREIEPVTVGLTGVDAALAETGTLALRSGPGRPRLASLSVRTHIALVRPEQLHASWAAWWAAWPEAAAWARAGSNLALISGPSRTADIEMTLTVGVHGPAETIVIFLG